MLINPATAGLADQDNAHPGECPSPAFTGVGHPPTPCGHSSVVSKRMSTPQDNLGSEGPQVGWGDEVSAGREPAEDLGLGIASSFLIKEVLYEEGHRDTNRDTFPDGEEEERPPAPDDQRSVNSKDSTLPGMIQTYAEGRKQGFTLSHLWEDTKQSGHFRDTNRDTLKRTLNRMAKNKSLAKIGEGQQALFCKPEHEEAVLVIYQAAQAPQVTHMAAGKAPNCKSTSPRLPRVEDLLMKKPKVLPQPLSCSWGLGLELIVSVSTGNVIIVGGSTDAGKTVLLLDFVMRNMDEFPIRYINWEMDEGELYERLRLLSQHYDVNVDSFYDKVEFVDWYSDAMDEESMNGLVHLIHPDKVNIIDYLTANDKFYMIGGILERIHNKLGKGIALVALQKDLEADLPYGKGHTQKVSRLALTLDPAPEKGPDCSLLRFTKAKGRVNRKIKPNRGGNLLRHPGRGQSGHQRGQTPRQALQLSGESHLCRRPTKVRRQIIVSLYWENWKPASELRWQAPA